MRQSHTHKKYSVIVPIYNEDGNVTELHQQITKEMKSIGGGFEIIFVNDGSSDKTANVLKDLSPLTVINFRKNFGQTAALDAGIKQACGDFIITLDAELQNPPSEIPKLVKALHKKGVDVVSGWRRDRKDPLSKRLSSRFANGLRWILVKDGIHDSGCTLKVYRKECFDGLDLHGEMHRFIPAILKIKGFRIAEEVVLHRPRVHGKSKYNGTRSLKGFVDMISVWFWRKYSARPMHLFGGLGVLFISISLVLAGIAIYRKIFFGEDLSDTAMTLFSGFLFLFGIQFFISGLLADMIIKSYYAKNSSTNYSIKDIKKQ